MEICPTFTAVKEKVRRFFSNVKPHKTFQTRYCCFLVCNKARAERQRLYLEKENDCALLKRTRFHSPLHTLSLSHTLSVSLSLSEIVLSVADITYRTNPPTDQSALFYCVAKYIVYAATVATTWQFTFSVAPKLT